MKILTSNYPNHIDSDIKEYFTLRNIAFIDIETDGLSHKNKIILIGLILFSKDAPNGMVIQIFNDDYQSEKQILLELWDLLNKHKIENYISFNGDSFDFPFMNARLRHLKLNRQLDKRFNIDLLREVRRNKASFPIPSFTLKSIEQFLKIERQDIISGKDSILLYHSYIETKDPNLEHSILLHNYDDIVNMVPLLNIYESISFPAPNKQILIHDQPWSIVDVELSQHRLKIILSHPFSNSLLESYYESIGISFKQLNGTIDIELSINTLKSKASSTITGETLSIINTYEVWNKEFSTLNQQEKESYIIARNQKIHWDNLINIIIEIVDTTLSNLIMS